MKSEIVSRNLRRLRLQKNWTQEQLAAALGVSVQSVSRWECATTLPDVMLLPEIARLYGITVDDLFREAVIGYRNYAQRLLAVYEVSGRSEDFLAAEQEFIRMGEKESAAEDLRAWGVLYHYMMKRCAVQAQRKLEQAMAHPNADEQTKYAAAIQEIAFLCDIGQGSEAARKYDAAISKKPSDYRSWLMSSSAYYFSGNYEKSLEVARSAIEKFPDRPALHMHAGDNCRALKRYDEAFVYWEKVLELDHDFLDAWYSMASCYEERGMYEDAYKIWLSLLKELDCRGLTVEREQVARFADQCCLR